VTFFACTTPTAGGEVEPFTASPAVAEATPARRGAVDPTPAAAPLGTEAAKAPAVTPPLNGRWTSEGLCLQLFDNGDFELSIMDPGAPKVMVLGQAKLTQHEAFATAELTVERIWRARYLGPCRRIHETGRWSESESALGRTFTPGSATKVRITRTGDDAIELCAEACVTLKRATPELVASWRVEGLESPRQPGASWKVGELLELRIDGASSHVWVGGRDNAFATVQGATIVTSTGPDTFDLTFTPGRLEDAMPPELLAGPLKTGEARSFTLRRLPHERLEVCASEACVTLERRFDPSAYELD
jgi:hypothetical protein